MACPLQPVPFLGLGFILMRPLLLCSQTLFKEIRHMPRAQQEKPVTVHINYHPDKNERQRAVMKYYIDGDDHALDAFPGGSEPGS